jgi:hypothetical protein
MEYGRLLKLLFAEVWSLFAGIGYVQISFDPFARRGRGQVWMMARDPETVFPDPFATSEDELAWVQFYDDLYLDRLYDRCRIYCCMELTRKGNVFQTSSLTDSNSKELI